MTDQTIAPASPRTVADVLADLNLDEALENAITPTCECEPEEGGPACGAPATFARIISCGHADFWCTEHAEMIQASIAEWLAKGGTLKCILDKSASLWHPTPMRVTVRFERIAS